MHRVLEDGVRIQPDAPDGQIGGNSVYRSGAPRSMKVGTILSLWRSDAESNSAPLRPNLAGLRRPLHEAHSDRGLSEGSRAPWRTA
jgi:hypothetical protein